MLDKKVYIWQSSIPDAWKRIAGEENFIHISKSNQAKNTLEFLEETQRYILKIRNPADETSKLNKNWPTSKKTRSFKKKLSMISVVPPVQIVEEKLSIILPELIGDVLLPSISEKYIKKNEPSVKRNYSTSSLPVKSYLKFTNNHEEYSKRNYQKQVDYLNLPKALKANFNRVFNSFRAK